MRTRVIMAVLLVCGQGLVHGCRHAGVKARPDGTATAASDRPAPAAVPVLLGPGDEVSITVWRNNELTCTPRVDPNGNISVPLAGEVHAAGLGLPELRVELTKRLAKYLVNPQVQVNLTALRSRKFHVLGEVKSPGTFVLDETVGPWDAIAKAGGFTVDANQRHVLLVHNDHGTGRIAALNMRALYEDKNAAPLGLIQSGDVLYVLPSRLANIERFMQKMQNILAPVLGLEYGIVMGDQVKTILEGGRGVTSGVLIAR